MVTMSIEALHFLGRDPRCSDMRKRWLGEYRSARGLGGVVTKGLDMEDSRTNETAEVPGSTDNHRLEILERQQGERGFGPDEDQGDQHFIQTLAEYLSTARRLLEENGDQEADEGLIEATVRLLAHIRQYLDGADVDDDGVDGAGVDGVDVDDELSPEELRAYKDWRTTVDRFIRLNRLGSPHHPFESKGRGQPCKPGETRARSGCRPVNRLGKPGPEGHAKPGPQGHQGIVGRVGAAYASARGALSAAGKAVYDRLPRPVQATIDLGMAAHHKAEAAFKGGQALAIEVARKTCRHCSEVTINRTAKVLSWADTAGRYVVSTAVEAALHPVGGPVVASVGAKTSYFIPVCSLTYVAGKLAVHTARGGDPFQLIRECREAIQQAKLKTTRSGYVKPRRTVEHALGDRDKEAVADLLKLFSASEDPDRLEALLAAALDEVGPDNLSEAVELATAALSEFKTARGTKDVVPQVAGEMPPT